jgi:hypothetical protein
MVSEPRTDEITAEGTPDNDGSDNDELDPNVFMADDDDGQNSTVNSSGDANLAKKAASDDPALAKNETRAVNTIRVFMMLLLVGVAAAVSYFAYEVTRATERETFESTFFDQATKVTETFSLNADRRMTALLSFSQFITTYALSSGETFPLVTVPGFERQATYALKLADSPALLVFPIVTTENRSAWESYSNASQGWMQESLQAQSEISAAVEGEEDDIDALRENSGYDEGLNEDSAVVDEREEQGLITPIIFKVDPATGDVAMEDGPGPYAPIWQHAPVLPVPLLVNFNSWSHPTRFRELAALVQTQEPLLSSAADFRDEDPLTANRKTVMNLFLNRWKNGVRPLFLSATSISPPMG